MVTAAPAVVPSVAPADVTSVVASSVIPPASVSTSIVLIGVFGPYWWLSPAVPCAGEVVWLVTLGALVREGAKNPLRGGPQKCAAFGRACVPQERRQGGLRGLKPPWQTKIQTSGKIAFKSYAKK